MHTGWNERGITLAPLLRSGREIESKTSHVNGTKGVGMNRKYLSLSAILFAGTCVGVAPAWSAGSNSGTSSGTNSSSSSDQSQPGSMGTSSDSSNTNSGSMGSSMHQRSGSRMSGQGNVKDVQEALKDKGFDPGPIDGVMGHKTQEALRSFQQSKNLKVTGRLDSETAQQLGVSSSAAGMSSSPSSSSSNVGSSTSPRANMGKSPAAPSSNTNTGTADSPSSDTSQMPGGATRGSNTGSGH